MTTDATPRTAKGRQAPPADESAPPPLAAAPAAAWKRASQTGELFRLPGSGLVARLRRPSLYALTARGVAVGPVSREVMRLLAVAERPQTEDERIDAFQKNARAFVEVARLAFTEPRIVADGETPNYDAGEIAVEDLADGDLPWIFYDFLEGREEHRAPFRLPG
jgi:hypothetical protein